MEFVSSSVGMMTFHSQLFLESHKIPWFQTTNQYITIIFPLLLVYTLFLITINHHIFNQTYGKIWKITIFHGG
jgi:hypothetical protein